MINLRKQILCLVALWPCVGFAQFLVFDDATTQVVSAQKAIASAPTPVAEQYKTTAPAAAIAGRVRTIVKHKGRKPAIFGRPVSGVQDHTLSALVMDVMPVTFQAFAASDVNMESPVKVGAANNWIDAIAYALRDTPYTVTIDWDKKEISFDVDSDNLHVTRKEDSSTKKWEAKVSDGLLSSVLSRWCKESDGECGGFTSTASHDFEIGSDIVFSGSFKGATDQLILTINESAGNIFEIKQAAENKIVLSDIK